MTAPALVGAINEWRDFTGKEHTFTPAPADNVFAADLAKTVIAPAHALLRELDAARAQAKRHGLRGFELHEAAGTVRPRVHREVQAMRDRVVARGADLNARFAEVTKFTADKSKDTQNRYAAIRAKLPTPNIEGAIRFGGGAAPNPSFRARLCSLDLEEASAVLAAPYAVDPRFVEAAQAVWNEHRAGEDPELFEAIRAEANALTWANKRLGGLLHLAAPPAIRG